MEYRVISADSHVVEPPHLWQEYLPKEYQEFAPKMVRDQDGGELDAVFSSSDPSVATVSPRSGVLEGLTPGEVTVVASAEGRVVEGVFTVAASQSPEPVEADTPTEPEDPADRLYLQTEVDQLPDEDQQALIVLMGSLIKRHQFQKVLAG